MINVDSFIKVLHQKGISFCSGVPDSLLAPLCQELEKGFTKIEHCIAANEGLAVSVCIGYHLATGRIPVVYFQNSGLGNALNPLVSAASREVYSIPLLLVIGWRGEVDDEGLQLQDEPQHLVQGASTREILSSVNISSLILRSENFENQIDDALRVCREKSEPVALLVKRGMLRSGSNDAHTPNTAEVGMLREDAIQTILPLLGRDMVVVSTTGYTSRELYSNRHLTSAGKFLNVGAMGHASSVAFGIASQIGAKKVICLDGDGALRMHMGALLTTSLSPNIVHVAFNNGIHESVGGFGVPAADLDLSKLASICGYKISIRVTTRSEVEAAVLLGLSSQCSTFIEVIIREGFRKDLARPENQLLALKNKLLEQLNGEVVR